MKRILLLLLLVSNLANLAYAVMGIGIGSGNITSDQFTCLKNSKNQYLVVQVYDPSGQVDEDGINNLIATSTIDGNTFDNYYAYITPCLANCKNGLTSAADQVNAALKAVNEISLSTAFVLINVDKSQSWSSDQQENQQFLMKAINTAYNDWLLFENGGVGVMTNYNSWSSVVGPNFDVSFQAQYLFWVNWNGIQDLTTGFNPFGGWNQPYAHQYAGAITSNNCVPGINVSYDYLADTGFEAIKKNQTRRSAKNRTISKT